MDDLVTTVTLPSADPDADIWPSFTVDHSQKLGGDPSAPYLIVVATFGNVTQRFRLHLEPDGEATVKLNPDGSTPSNL